MICASFSRRVDGMLPDSKFNLQLAGSHEVVQTDAQHGEELKIDLKYSAGGATLGAICRAWIGSSIGGVSNEPIQS